MSLTIKFWKTTEWSQTMKFDRKEVKFGYGDLDI